MLIFLPIVERRLDRELLILLFLAVEPSKFLGLSVCSTREDAAQAPEKDEDEDRCAENHDKILQEVLAERKLFSPALSRHASRKADYNRQSSHPRLK